MLRLFGIPYITAPMEAEAQCAELVTLGLVDGVITDDSDTFLFGAERVFKNMFNQSKTVECFLLTDLDRELGLDRDTLIQLAYLLGSDYTDGLAGVGPVVAMELVREFPGKDGLWKFKDWWTKVQSGKDTERESGSKFRRMFVSFCFPVSRKDGAELLVCRKRGSRIFMSPRSGQIRLLEMPIIIQPLTAQRNHSNGGCLTLMAFGGAFLSLSGLALHAHQILLSKVLPGRTWLVSIQS
jgi:XPG I-region